MRLKDQVAIVTGAGRNIGEDICRLYVKKARKSPWSIWIQGAAAVLRPTSIRRILAKRFRSYAMCRHRRRSTAWCRRW